MRWNNRVRVLKRKDSTFLWKDGIYDRIPSENYYIINEIINRNISMENISIYFELIEDTEYICKLVKKLQAMQIIVENDYMDVKKDISNTVTIMLTNQCNLQCIHCCQDAGQEKNKIGELTETEIFRVIDRLKTIKIADLTITGGEPLIRKDFIRIIDYISSELKCHLSLLTNGLLIDDGLAKYLSRRFNSISLSIDGSNSELTKIIRNQDVFDIVISKIKLLQKYNVKNISLSAVLPAIREVEDEFLDLCKKLNVQPIMRKYSRTGRGDSGEKLILEKYQKYAHKNSMDFYNRYFAEDLQNIDCCSACSHNFTIDPMGKVFPCNILLDSTFEIGSIFDNNIFEKIYRFERIEKYKNFEGTICEQCDYNFLCWHCISEFNSLEKNKKEFRDRCKIKKSALEKLIWNN